MEDVKKIAEWFLFQESMTHKKLQKLCYYAQSWYIALYDGTPLFEDEIQAWVHGSIIVSLYPKYSSYKWNPIPNDNIKKPKFNKKVTNLLEMVYNTYKDLSGEQLEWLTHSEDPWIKARGNLKPYEICTNPISIEEMRRYYSRKYKQAQND